MLGLPEEVASAMVLMENQAREKWSSIVRDKLAYMDHVPRKLAGAFAHLADPEHYSLSTSKRVVRECFEEYRTLQEQGRSTAILQSLFERGGTGDVADQLWAYGNSNDQLRLEDFPLAWVELQERAFCTNVERTTERQHVLVKLGGRRSLRCAGPAITCVRARRAQLQAMIDNASSFGFLVQRWRKRTLFSDLLSHVVTSEECRRMTMSMRVSRLYAYSEADHFMDDLAEEERSADALAAATSKALKDTCRHAEQPLHKHQWMIVDYIKSQLPSGAMFSVPEMLFRLMPLTESRAETLAGEDDGDGEADLADLSLEGFAAALLPDEIPALVTDEHVFCYILDAWPERRTRVATLAAAGAERRGLMHVMRFLSVDLPTEQGPVVSYSKVRKHTFDLCNVATLENMKLVSSLCHVWTARCKGVQLQLLPSSYSDTAAAAQRAIPLPEFVTDDDLLIDVPRPVEQPQEAVAVPGQPRGIQLAPGLLSNTEQIIVNELFAQRAIGESFVDAANLNHYSAAALQTLADKGIVLFRHDEQSLQLALSEDTRMSSLTQLTDPLVFCRHEGDMQNPAGRNKLAWLKNCLQKHWTVTRNKPQWKVKDSANLLPGHALDAPEAYLKALALQDSIWAKPGDLARISRSGSAAYYQMLLQQSDLTGIQEWTLQQCREFAFPKKRKGPRQHDNRPAPVASQPLRLQLDLPLEPPVQARVPGLQDYVVYFDNYTHQSGHRRCFIKCLHGAHAGSNCRRYTFVNQHADQATAVAWLLAWAQDAPRHRSGDAHVAYNPSTAAVRSMKERQRLGQ